MELLDLIQFINDRHHTTFAFVGPCAGGLQGGAYELLDKSTNKQVVLKCSFASRAPVVIDRLRSVGYPTPDWLVVGESPDGTRYVVQSFATGSPMRILTSNYLYQILAINELQAGLNPHPKDDQWSQYAHNVVFANEGGWAELIEDYSYDTRTLMKAMRATAEPYANLKLPTTDVVHGDFNPDNLLVMHGHITAVIDSTYAGYGTRVIDLATLLHYAYAFSYDRQVREALCLKSLQIAGQGVLTVCLIYRTMAMLEWAIQRDTPESVQRYVCTAWEMINDLHL